jgi:CelD/BcsL family acetyltransferase involved in cellulose biosynthesis
VKVTHLAAFDGPGPGPTAWDALVARSRAPAPFSGWAFQTAWHRAFAGAALHLFGVQGGDGEWVGLLPLYEATDPAGPVWRLVGGTDVADYLDLVCVRGREEEAWVALLPVLAASAPGPVDLRPIPAGSPTASILERLAPAAGLSCRVAVEDRCPVIALPATWDAYLATLSGKDRHELRRKLRRAEAGEPRVEVARTPEAVAALLDGFLSLHRLSKVGKARFMDAQMEAFFREIGGALAAAGQAALWMLWLADRPAAALFCLEYGDTVGLYNSGFDPEARAMSPGVVLIARTIEDAIARRFARYDFLRGDEPYKYGFGAVPTDVLRVTLARRAADA